MCDILTYQLWLMACSDMIEDMVTPLIRQLKGHPGLLQQILKDKNIVTMWKVVIILMMCKKAYMFQYQRR